uniref:Uncharacterized protein n=1 Tax=Anopheles dirus TaxID=7168 RepID=A0A182NTB0_9DIPT
MNVEQIRRLEQQSTAGSNRISTTNDESRTMMRSVETQTERLEGVGACCACDDEHDDGASVSGLVPDLGHDDDGGGEEERPFVDGVAGDQKTVLQVNGCDRAEDRPAGRCESDGKPAAGEDDEVEEEVEQDDEAEERSRRVRLVAAANNMFNFNKLEILNERSCSGSASSEGGSQRGNIAVPALLRSTSSGGGASTSDSNRNLCENEMTVAVDDAFAAAACANEHLKQRDGDGCALRLDSLDAIFIQESPEVIL